MALELDLLDRAAWTARPVELDDLDEYDDGGVAPVVTMRFAPRVGGDGEAWARLRALWLDAPRHPNLLDAMDEDEAGGLVLRYAALDWHRPPIAADSAVDTARLASWGLQIADAFAAIRAQTADHDLALLSNPLVWMDLGDKPRIAFLPPTAIDVVCDERTLVGVVHALVAGPAIDRGECATLSDLKSAFVGAGGSPRSQRRASRLAAWDHAEAGHGWLQLGEPARALAAFDASLRIKWSQLAAVGGRRARAWLDALLQAPAPVPTPTPVPVPAPVIASPRRALVTDEVRGLYLRGRELFALGRLVEARDAFDAALARAPAMIEAMLLRREADRSLRAVRVVVGVEVASRDQLPDQLAGLSDALVNGRAGEAIAELVRPRYATDLVAQLLLGNCLLFEHRPAEALAAYLRVADVDGEHQREALLGAADALLALGRAAEALAYLDRLVAQTPTDADALEVRARALEQLG